jgi:cytochrome c-type biogenesis protein
MSLDAAALPIAFAAGVVGVLSPCVWPLVPVVASSAATAGRSGVLYLAAGLAVSFAVAGTLLTWALTGLGLDPELFRYLAGFLLAGIALVILVEWLAQRVTLALSRVSSSVGSALGAGPGAESAPAQFGVGALLGVVWLPCVGPTLGAAIALASMGQDLFFGFWVMLAYGIGTAGVLLGAGLASRSLVRRWSPVLMGGGRAGRTVLGWSLLVLGLLVLSGTDKVLEAFAVDLLPAWVFSF